MFVTLKAELEGSFVFQKRKAGDVSTSAMLRVRAEHGDRWWLASGGELKDQDGYAVVHRDGERRDRAEPPKSYFEWKVAPKECFEAHLFLDDAAFDEFMHWLRAGHRPSFLPHFLIGPQDSFKAIPPCYLRFATDLPGDCDVIWDNSGARVLELDGFTIRYSLEQGCTGGSGPQ